MAIVKSLQAFICIQALISGFMAGMTLACESGWVSRPASESCYKFITSPTENWKVAESRCRDLGGYLANLESEEEIVWMHGYRSYHLGLRRPSWVGGYEKEQVWYWKGLERDIPIKFFDWGKTEPDNRGGYQDCISLFGEFTRTGIPVGETWFRFDDDGCDKPLSYICEKPV